MRLYQPTYRNAAGELAKSPVWSVDFFVRGKRYSRTTHKTDKRVAKTEAARIVTESRAEVESGAVSPGEAKKLPMSKLLADYVADMGRRGLSATHVARTKERCEFLLERVQRLGDATRPVLRAALGRVAERRTKHPGELGEGRLPSPQTVNAYRTALHGLFEWIVMDLEALAANPVAAIKRVKTAGATFERRALTPEEFQTLMAVVPDTIRGRERRAVYLVAATTGLRRKELRGLLVSSVSLEHGLVTLPGTKTKNGAKAVQQLGPEIVEALRPYVEGREAGASLFRAVPRVATLRVDLEAAGLSDEIGGARFDFHALRVQFGTSLARANVPLSLAQELLRHSDPKLTSNLYTRFEPHDERAAVEAVSKLLTHCDVTKDRQSGEDEPLAKVV